MKGFIAFLLLVLVALCGYNWWEIQALRKDIAGLQAKVTEQTVRQQNARTTDDMLARANEALQQARAAIASTDTVRARAALDNARERSSAAAKVAGEKAAPTIKWLQNEANDLSRQVQDRMNKKP